jgi:MoxR-like ATPase
VSIDGQSLELPAPFIVLATQNPQDFAGTFPLPESQLDRFMVRISIGYPPPQVETRLIVEPEMDRVTRVRPVMTPQMLVQLHDDVGTVRIDHALATYLQALSSATRASPAVGLGASPRAAKSLARAARARALLHGRTYCIADDIHELAVPVLAHRIRLAAQTEGYAPSREEAETTLREIAARVPVPL